MLAMVASCSDDLSLRVLIDHPMAVTRTEISVYESGGVDCESIEFGDLDQAQLAAASIAEETLAADGTVSSGDLDSLSRTETKVIVARGYGDDGALVTAGCAEKGVIEGNDVVKITTVLAATVSIAAIDPEGATDPYGIGVTTTGPDGDTLTGRKVSWRVYGPAGSSASTSTNITSVGDGVWQPAATTCTKNGLAQVHPIAPDQIGGFAVQVRVSWAAATPPLTSTLTKVSFNLSAFTPPIETTHPCAIRVSGTTQRLVCIDKPLVAGPPVARDYPVTYANGSVTLGAPATMVLPANPPMIGVYAIPTGNDREVYAVDQAGTIIPLFGASAAQPTGCPGCTGLDDFLFAPACGTDPAKLVLHMPGAVDRVKIFDARGGGVATELPLGLTAADLSVRLNNAGCVTTLDPKGHTSAPRQLVVVDVIRALVSSTRGFYNCAGTSCNKVSLPVPEAGVGFTGGTEPRLVGTFADATGVVLSSWVVLPDQGMPDRLVERERMPAASVPHRIVVGQLDDDAGIDLFWDLQLRRGTTFEIAYARTVGDQRLEAVSLPQSVIADDLLVGDVTGDHHDDIIVVGKAATGTPATGVVVIPTHVAPQQVAVIPDLPCP